MKIFNVNPQNPSKEAILAAGKAVKSGKIICYPTETLYGIGGDAHSEEVCLAVNKAKKRPEQLPLIVLILCEEAGKWIKDFDRIEPLTRVFWPGPLTIVVEPNPLPIPSPLKTHGNAVAFRAAATPLLEELVRECGGALSSTSANISGEAPIRCIKSKTAWLEGFCEVALDAGVIEKEIPSTVVDARLFPEKLVIVRGGAIPAGKLWEAFPKTKIESE